MSPIRFALASVSRPGSRARLSVLIFHRVLPDVDAIFPEEMHQRRFEQTCQWLKAWFNVLPLDAAVRQLQSGTLPSRACCITFDDGYADNLAVAVPILQRHGLCATFFIATGYLDGGRMWNDTVIESIRRCSRPDLHLGELGSYELQGPVQRRKAIDALLGKIKYMAPDERVQAGARLAEQAEVELPTDLMMRADEVRKMRQAGMQIGAHTVNHPILAKLASGPAGAEIQDSRLFLQDLLQERIGLFAYPNGKPGTDYLPEHVAMVRELGFDAAVSTAWGAAGPGTDRFQIPRFTPWDRSRTGFGARLVRNLVTTSSANR